MKVKKTNNNNGNFINAYIINSASIKEFIIRGAKGGRELAHEMCTVVVKVFRRNERI